MLLRSAGCVGFTLLAFAGPLLGCSGAPADRAGETIASTDEAIAGGVEDDKDVNVLGVFDSYAGTQCSGSLIAPNVVLTAHHCVAPLLDETNGEVVCATTGFGPTDPAAAFYVTTKTVMDMTAADYHTVQKVVTVPDTTLLCGFDQAILILSAPIAASEAVPLVPRVDSPLTHGEGYTAIGYGGTDNTASNAGTRRRRDGLFVDCVGEACPSSIVKSTEFIGDTGVCEGDSGGPALDLQGRVVGVTSRGGVNCSSPVYGAVYGWAQWIQETTVQAATLGGYAAPAWTAGGPTDPEYTDPVGGACTAPSDCASGRCLGDVDGPYCTRLCDKAACPSGFTCDATDYPSGPLCVKLASSPKSANQPPVTSTSAGSCSAHPADRDATHPIPWFAGAALVAALAASRRRRS